MHNDEQGRDWNEGHPDHEGEMAVTQLHRLSEMADMLLDIIGPNDDLPGWIQYKLTRAYSDLNDVFGYMEAKAHEHAEDPQGLQAQAPMIASEGKKKKGLWANIHARRKAGKRPKKPGEKGYPKTLDIESDIKEAIQKLVRNELRRK